MSSDIIGRPGHTAVVILIVSAPVFLLVCPRGDPISLMAPPDRSPEPVEALRQACGLDRSPPEPERQSLFPGAAARLLGLA